jgi:hypothetical protein
MCYTRLKLTLNLLILQVELHVSNILSTIIAGLLKWTEVFIFYENDTGTTYYHINLRL